MHQRPRPQRGFGLLEAIVAMVILGSSGLVLFSWINQNLMTATRLKEAESRARLQLEAQAWVATLNPAKTPEGQQALGAMQVKWRSELIEPMRDEFDQWGNLTPHWQLGLYRVHAQAQLGEAGEAVEWRQVVAGWRLKAGHVASAGEEAAR